MMVPKEFGNDLASYASSLTVRYTPTPRRKRARPDSGRDRTHHTCHSRYGAPQQRCLASTKGSAKHEMVDEVVTATKLAKEMDPLDIDGELQADAAIIPAMGEESSRQQNSRHANVLVFPTLEAGNIAYKLVQRMARAEAIGPVLQGMAAPINDLSRGCSVSDIVNLVAITACQAQGLK